jgi:N-acyl homoserine lactone hydrolase
MARLRNGEYDVATIIQGFPGKSENHGFLGWSTVGLLRGYGRTVLVDTGSMGMRRMVIARLAELGTAPADITDVLLTHSHHDHAINWTLFPNARIHIGETELAWALEQPWGETSVPELYMRELHKSPALRVVEHGQEVIPRVKAALAPGHTPGSLIYNLEGVEHDFIFTGDSAKNRAELLSGMTDMTYDAAVSTLSIKMIWELWSRKDNSILIPGHDLAMIQIKNGIRYIEKRQAAIRTWFGNDMKSTSVFPLT